MLSLQGSSGKIAPNNWVHHNHFKDFTTSDADNDNTALQPGYGNYGTSKANMIVEHNLFENLSADAEGVLSAKCWDVTFRYNTIKNCTDTSLRNGEEHKVYGNYFFNSRLRFSDSNHRIFNNVFVGSKACIVLFSQIDLTKTTGYSHIRPVNCFVGYNTFVNTNNGFLSNGDGGSQDLRVVNNIFYNCSKAVQEAGAKMDGVLYDTNIIWLGDKYDHPANGIISSDPLFEYDSDGVPSIKTNSPAIDKSVGDYTFVLDDMDGQSRTGLKDIGADELGKGNRDVRVMTASKVGSNAEGSTLSVNDFGSKSIESNLLIYPNPAKNSFTLESLGKDISGIEIFNLSGALVYKSTSQTSKLTIDKSLYSGVYIVMIKLKDASIITQKLIIE